MNAENTQFSDNNISGDTIRLPDLTEWLSIDAFHSSSYHDLQNGIRSRLIDLLKASVTVEESTNSPCVSYNVELLTRGLRAGIEWSFIFSHHDKLEDTAAAVTTATPTSENAKGLDNNNLPRKHRSKVKSVLTAYLDLLQDPCTWPKSCHLSTITVLVEALLDHGASLSLGDRKRSPAQCYVRRFILTTFDQIPLLRQEYTVAHVLPKIRIAASLSRIQQRLSLLREWMHKFPSWRKCFVSTVYDILSALDKIDQSEGENRGRRLQQQYKDQTTTSSKYKLVRGSFSLVDHLHADVESESSALAFSKTLRHYKSSTCLTSNQSAKQVLKSSVVVSSSKTKEKEQKLRIDLRAKCFDRILSIYETKGRLGSLEILKKLLDEAPQYTHLSSISWFIILYVNRNRSQQIHMSTLTNLLWNRRHQHPFFVTLFFEILCECSYFDNITFMWIALQPFVSMIDDCMETAASATTRTVHDCSEKGETNDNKTTICEPMYLHNFAMLLTRRGALLKHHKHFVGVAAQLSVLFGEEGYWIAEDTAISQVQQIRIVEALQSAAILGVSWKNNDMPSRTSGQKFTGLLKLRYGSKFCAWDNLQKNVLSVTSLNNGVPKDLLDKENELIGKQKELIDKQKSEVRPVSINTDVLEHIFSYLGFKRVVGLTTVCKEWRCCADNNRLWQELYKFRYQFLPQDMNALDENQPWKLLFQEMILAERERISLRSRSTRNFSVCGFVGCTTFLSTKRQIEAHYNKHIKAFIGGSEEKCRTRKRRSSLKPKPGQQSKKKRTDKNCENSVKKRVKAK